MQEQTKLFAVSLLRRWVQNLRCLKHIVRQYINVSFGVGCFNTQIENCRLCTMTPSDNCCVNQEGVVRQDCSYTIMFHRLMQ